MSYHTSTPLHSCNGRSRGFTLVELMIAITVALFLIAGVLTLVQSTRNAFGNQNLLAQLQDNQRLAMTFMAEVVETAGYFPDPVHNTNSVLPAVGAFAVGQAVSGTTVAASDQITIRYAAAPNDDVFNCKGVKNTTAALDVFVDTFWVDTTVPGNPVLTCNVSSATTGNNIPVPLVNGVKTLTVLYGVKRSAADTGSCADTYLTTAQMTAADWGAVCTISLTIVFINPIPATGPPLLPINRVIAVMMAAGVNS